MSSDNIGSTISNILPVAVVAVIGFVLLKTFPDLLKQITDLGHNAAQTIVNIQTGTTGSGTAEDPYRDDSVIIGNNLGVGPLPNLGVLDTPVYGAGQSLIVDQGGLLSSLTGVFAPGVTAAASWLRDVLKVGSSPSSIVSSTETPVPDMTSMIAAGVAAGGEVVVSHTGLTPGAQAWLAVDEAYVSPGDLVPWPTQPILGATVYTDTSGSSGPVTTILSSGGSIMVSGRIADAGIFAIEHGCVIDMARGGLSICPGDVNPGLPADEWNFYEGKLLRGEYG